MSAGETVHNPRGPESAEFLTTRSDNRLDSLSRTHRFPKAGFGRGSLKELLPTPSGGDSPSHVLLQLSRPRARLIARCRDYSPNCAVSLISRFRNFQEASARFIKATTLRWKHSFRLLRLRKCSIRTGELCTQTHVEERKSFRPL